VEVRKRGDNTGSFTRSTRSREGGENRPASPLASSTLNDTLTLTVAGGQPSRPAMMVALSATVPSGLAGIALDLVGLGIVASGKPRFSNEVELTFN